jgi:hypothetical protein
VNAHSGTVGYFEGDVSIDGVKLVSQIARFSDVKEQGVLKTDLGRAEIMLTPGVLLRVGEHSSVKMLDNRLMSTRVEFLSGTAMLESADSGATVKDPPVTIIYGDFSVEPVRNGIVEISSAPGQIRVFKGEAKLFGNGTSTSVKDGNKVELTSAMASAKFDAKEADDLYLWSRDRSAYLSAGNMASARQMGSSGYANGFAYSNSSYGIPGWDSSVWRGFSGGWYYNQGLGMYSYIPFSGTVYSPFGYGLYNPVTIAYVYVPGYYWNGAGGSRTGTTTGVPLSTINTTVNTSRNQPQLPRLGITATLRPSLSSPLRGTELGAATSSISSRNSLAVFPQNSGFGSTQSSASSNISSVAPISAPAASAPAMAAPAAAAHAAAPVAAHR